MEFRHQPVMMKEVVEALGLKPGDVVVDGTVGCGGHSCEIAKHISPGGRLIGIDQDKDVLPIAKLALEKNKLPVDVRLVWDNFRNLRTIFKQNDIAEADGLLLDLGVSSLQFDVAQRGFSLKQEGPLDMRMDRERISKSAYELVNYLPPKGLEQIIKEFGQERFARRIARRILFAREDHPIETTTEFASLVSKAISSAYYKKKRRPRSFIHPATRTFQGIRIAVNKELESLEEVLNAAPLCLKKGGRICVISFHSLEDRIVKNTFRKFAAEGSLRIRTKKPLVPRREEIITNPRARSAKLRIAEKVV